MRTDWRFVAGVGLALFLLLGVAAVRPSAQAHQPVSDAAGYKKMNGKSKIKFLKHAKNGIKDQYIVVLDDNLLGPRGDTSPAEEIADALVGVYGGKVQHKFKHALNGFSARLTEAEAQSMSLDPLVEYVEQDGEVAGTTTQSLPPSWGLDRVDQRPLPIDYRYSYTYSGAGVRVYVIDSGIKTNHSDFGGRALVGVDYVGDGWNGQDCHGHGTHVAGTIGGRNYGVAKGAWLYSVRVLGCANKGSYASIIAGVNWVTEYHGRPAVVNMSLGAPASSALDAAVAGSVAAGVTYVVAAGNEGQNACNVSPARSLGTITVGATDGVDRRVVDTGWASNFGSCVDLFAPGYAIRSASKASTTASAVLSGTSMASPHVAGAAAIYLSAFPSATPSTVAAVIRGTATINRLSNIGAGSPNRLLFSQLHY